MTDEMIKVGVPKCYGCGRVFKSLEEQDQHDCPEVGRDE